MKIKLINNIKRKNNNNTKKANIKRNNAKISIIFGKNKINLRRLKSFMNTMTMKWRVNYIYLRKCIYVIISKLLIIKIFYLINSENPDRQLKIKPPKIRRSKQHLLICRKYKRELFAKLKMRKSYLILQRKFAPKLQPLNSDLILFFTQIPRKI